MDADVIISMEGVDKHFGTFRALHEINLQVRRRERIVLCGPSGSGKSTLIRCINQIEHHDKGRIIFDGVEVGAHTKGLDKVRREIGMVFQSFNLFPHLTVLENCTLAPMKVRGMAKRQPRRWRASNWSRCGSRSRRTSIRGSYRAGSSSAWRSRGRCACSPR